MRRFALLILLLTTIKSYSQKIPDFGANTVRIIDTNKTMLFGVLPTNDDIHLDANKTYFWYSGNLIHATQGGFSGKLLSGTYKEFYLSKDLKTQGEYKSGLKDGIWNDWNLTGELIRRITWNRGIQSGAFFEYDSNGGLLRKGQYQGGRLNGKLYQYKAGTPAEITTYRDGVQIPNKKPLIQRLNIFKRRAGVDSVSNGQAKPQP